MAYFANSSEEVLSEQCADCPLGYGWNDPSQKPLFPVEQTPKPCPVALIQLQYNYEQLGNPCLRAAMNCLVSESGICQVRKLLVEERQREQFLG